MSDLRDFQMPYTRPTAHEMLTRVGADAFAERARRELLATGEEVRRRSVKSGDALTAQETQIARLAGGGLTNPEIAAQLFISAHIEWHLRKGVHEARHHLAQTAPRRAHSALSARAS